MNDLKKLTPQRGGGALARMAAMRYHSPMANELKNISSLPSLLETPLLEARLAFTSAAARRLYAETGSGPFPEAATPFSAGCDLRACIEAESAAIEPGGRLAVPAGFSIQIQSGGWAAFIYSRSGLGARDGLTVAQGVGVVDPDYRGEIVVYLLNTSGRLMTITRGERVAQLVFQPFARPAWLEVDALEPTARGSGGFGHTGL